MTESKIIKKAISYASQAESDCKSLKADEIREALALIKSFQKDLDNSYKILEAEAIKRNLSDKMLVEHEMKFQIRPGNDKSEFNVVKIGKILPIEKLAKIVNVVEGRAKEVLTETELKVLEMNRKVVPSDKLIVSISKMTKQELREAQG